MGLSWSRATVWVWQVMAYTQDALVCLWLCHRSMRLGATVCASSEQWLESEAGVVDFAPEELSMVSQKQRRRGQARNEGHAKPSHKF